MKREEIRRRGMRLTMEWNDTVAQIKQSGADLSKIILTEEPIRGQIKELKNG